MSLNKYILQRVIQEHAHINNNLEILSKVFHSECERLSKDNGIKEYGEHMYQLIELLDDNTIRIIERKDYIK